MAQQKKQQVKKSLAAEFLGVLFGPSTPISGTRQKPSGNRAGKEKACNCDGDRKR